MAVQIEVKGGKVEIAGPVRRLTDAGIVTEFDWRAICANTGETFVWGSRSLAEYWLGIRQDHYDWQERRAGLVEVGVL